MKYSSVLEHVPIADTHEAMGTVLKSSGGGGDKQTNRNREAYIEGEREKEREKMGETDKHKEVHIHTEADRHREAHTHSKRERERGRQAGRR